MFLETFNQNMLSSVCSGKVKDLSFYVEKLFWYKPNNSFPDLPDGVRGKKGGKLNQLHNSHQQKVQ